ncbi:MAG: hypothetical protein AB7O24_29585 [Kofleriaceae bacterium]
MKRVSGLVFIGCLTFSTSLFAQGDAPPADPAAGGEAPAGEAPAADPAAPDPNAAPVTDGAPMAEEAPPPPAGGSVTLKKGGVNIQANIEINMSKEAVGKPFSIAPDVSYGVSDDLTLTLAHSNAALTGFRGGTGAGICVAGAENGCFTEYTAVGAEALYSVAKGPMALGVGGGLIFQAPLEDGRAFSVKVGAKGKYTAGKVVVSFAPSIWIGLTERDAGNKELLWIPVGVGFKATPELMVGAATGFKAPLDPIGDAWTIPIGVNGNYAVSPQIGVGASFTFGKIAGAEPTNAGADSRALHLWLNYNM